MSIKAMTWAFELEIPPVPKLILLAIADCVDAKGFGYPGQVSLARKVSMSERTIRTHVKWLEEHGFIARRARFRPDGKGRTSDGYQLNPVHQPADVAGKPTGSIASDQPADGCRGITREPSDTPPTPSGGFQDYDTLTEPRRHRVRKDLDLPADQVRTQPSTVLSREELDELDRQPVKPVPVEEITALRDSLKHPADDATVAP